MPPKAGNFFVLLEYLFETDLRYLIALLTLFVLSLKGIPVLIVKIHQLKRLKSIKAKGFSTFLLGTHPRLGEDSPVLMLAGTRSLNIGENVSKDFLLMISCLLIIKETILRKSEYQQKELKFKKSSLSINVQNLPFSLEFHDTDSLVIS